MGDLVEEILQLTEQLPTLLGAPSEKELETFRALGDAALDLWKLWREMQVEKDLATCR